jgi:hypothetical protein
VRLLSSHGFEELQTGLLCFEGFDLASVVERGEPLLAAGEQAYDFSGNELTQSDRILLQRASILRKIGLESSGADSARAQAYAGGVNALCVAQSVAVTLCGAQGCLVHSMTMTLRREMRRNENDRGHWQSKKGWTCVCVPVRVTLRSRAVRPGGSRNIARNQWRSCWCRSRQMGN